MAQAPLISRRRVLVALPVGLVAVACSAKGGKPGPGPSSSVNPNTIQGLQVGASPFQVLQAQSELKTGKSRFAFGLVTDKGQLLQGGSPQVYAALGPTAPLVGPFASTFYEFTADKQFNDTAPRSPLTGFYVAEVDLPSPGNWTMAAVAVLGSTKAVGVGAMKVTDTPGAPWLGSKAISVETPVATTEAGLKQICTRNPPDEMHYISLDKALTNGKPTVAVFATPLLCESQMCGPVTDEVYAVFQSVGKAKANFIHVEEFLPGPSLQPPAPTAENQSPGFKAWHLLTEPWVYLIDKGGTIQSAFEGPVVAQQIQADLAPLL